MSVRKAKPKAGTAGHTASRGVTDWRSETLEQVRRMILDADPEIVEERKWIKPTNPLGVAVWSRDGIICTGEIYKKVVKLTFARGASLPDPQRLFNASLEGNARRAIDLGEGELPDEQAFKALIRDAVAENRRTRKAKPNTVAKSKPVKLLSGGNPQIAKAYGDEPVQAYIAAMPGWKSDVGRRLDAIIERTIPGVSKAVKWNSPLYGIESGVWFLGIHVFAKYVKVAFFKGVHLKPLPPGTSKQKEVRYLDIHETDNIDEMQFARWVKQASQLPGEKM